MTILAILFVEKWLLVNLAQREEQFFHLYLAGSAQRESVYEKLPWIGTEPKNCLSLTVTDLVSKSQLS